MNNDSLQPSGTNGIWTLAALLIGAAAGASVALLLAPDTGEHTRERIRSAARRWRRSAADSLEDVREAVTGLGSDAQAALHAGQDSFARDRGARQTATNRRAMAPSGESVDRPGPAAKPGDEASR